MNLDTSHFVQKFHEGRIFAYPTEAVFGLGCDPQNEKAMDDILRLKHRPVEKGVILIAGEMAQLSGFVDFSPLSTKALDEINDTWPGPFTWLVPKGKKTPAWISGGSDLVAVRVTTHPLVQKMCAAVDSPMVSTSANRGGENPARSAQEVANYFGTEVILINGDLGSQQNPTTIINSLTMERIR